MKEITDGKLELFEDVALEGAKQIKAYFSYQGSEPKYREKARVGATAISAYARMRASETNRMAVEMMMEKQQAYGLLQAGEPSIRRPEPRLKAAK